MEKNEVQEKKCFDLLRRIGSLQLGQVHSYSQEKIDQFSASAPKSPKSPSSQQEPKTAKTKTPVPNVGDELDYTKLVLGGVQRDVPTKVGDTDETDPSSGDESCDEVEIGTKKIENYLPVDEGPGAQWAKDRGSVVASWTWLQDSVAYSSYQMKHHEKLYKHHRATKTPVAVDEKFSSPVRVPTNSSLVDAHIQVYKEPVLEQQNTIVSSSSIPPNVLRNSAAAPSRSVPLENFFSSIGRGPPLNLSGVSNIVNKVGSSDKNRFGIGGGLEPLQLKFCQQNDPTSEARRCLPTKQLRNRKLYPVQNVVESESDEQCECEGTGVCCYCIANNNNKIRGTMLDRASLLDNTFHQNLSLPDNIAMPVLIDASLHSQGWLNNTPRNMSTFIGIPRQYANGLVPKSGDENTTVERRKPRSPTKRKHDETATTSTHTPAAADERQSGQKLDKGSGKTARRASSGDFAEAGKSPLIKRRKYNSLSSTASKKKRQSLEYDSEEQYCEFATPSTPPTPTPARTAGRPRRRRDQSDKTDINNIVIPYSIAAATRIEKIEYKEIMTPSWRGLTWYEEVMLTMTPGGTGPLVPVEEEEDVSDDVMVNKHARCEIDERKRFMLSSMTPSARRQRRADSKTEVTDPISAPQSPKAGDHMPASPSVRSGDEGGNPQIVTAVAATMAVTAVKVQSNFRKRRTSMGPKKDGVEDEPLDDYGYSGRDFPLPDHAFGNMCSEMPDYESFIAAKKEGDGSKSTNQDDRRTTRHRKSK